MVGDRDRWGSFFEVEALEVVDFEAEVDDVADIFLFFWDDALVTEALRLVPTMVG